MCIFNIVSTFTEEILVRIRCLELCDLLSLFFKRHGIQDPLIPRVAVVENRVNRSLLTVMELINNIDLGNANGVSLYGFGHWAWLLWMVY